jgi:TRAP transporter 4TM/12TM fusion protein
VAVIASALMGTMNGTSAGNAVATGSFTIPLMRKVGYTPRFAAATEAVASTGGQIMPPVMGAGIFIMAELTGIPLKNLILAGIIPAVLYFISVYYMVDLEAVKLKLAGFPKEVLPRFWTVMKQSYLFMPILALLGMLILGYSVVMAGFIAIVSSLVVSWFRCSTAMGVTKILQALETGAKNAIQLMAVCAGAGIIMGVIALTGVGMKFATVILSIAGTSEFLALVFAMGIAIILGMGLPTTAAYAVAASVVAPGLIQMGIQPLVAHFFVFYFACVSAITPPVALASYAASGISGSDPMKTAVTSFRLGIAAYIVPFMFFYTPEILLQGEVLDVIVPALTAAIGVVGLACAVQRFYFGQLTPPVTVLLFAGSLSLVLPDLWMDIAGLGVMGLLLVYQKFYRHRGQAPGAPAAAG